MKFKADEIASVIQKEIEDFRGQLATSEVGQVLEVGDGIARCYGLSTAMAGEMVEFPNGVRGQVFNLEENSRRRHHPGRLSGNRRRGRGEDHRPIALGAGRRGADRPRGRSRWAIRSTAKARS